MEFNSSNFSNVDVQISDDEWRYRVESTVIVGLVNFAGFALSCLTIILTFTSDLKLNNVSLLLANLILGTLLHTFMFVLPQNLVVLYIEQLPSVLCGWLGYTFFILAAQMLLFPPFLAVNRYVSLYHNSSYDQIYTTKNIALMIAGSWVVAILIPLPFQLAGKTGFDRDNVHCCIVVMDSLWWTIYYTFVILVLLVGMCDGVMLYCNVKIYKKLQEHSHTNSLKNNIVNQNKELLYFMIADTVVPLFFHTVYHVAKVAYTFRENATLKLFLPTFYSGGVAVRCLVILILLRPYRQALKKLFGFEKSNKTAPAKP